MTKPLCWNSLLVLARSCAAAALSLGALVIPVSAVELLTNGGFESTTAGLPDSWAYAQGADGPATVQSAGSSPFININPAGAKSVLLTDGPGTLGTPSLTETFATQSGGLLYLAWDFRMESLTGNYWGVQFDDAISSLTRFDMDKSGKFTIETPSGTYFDVLTVTLNVWYQVQLALDMTNKQLSGSITTQAGVVTTIPTTSWRVQGAGSSFNRVLIEDAPDAAGAGQGGNLRLDNFSVNRTAFAPAAVPEPAAASLMLLGVAALVGRRRRQG